MNPITTRFSSVEALRASDVDVKALKTSGQIEVGGKHYQIRSAADGGFDVQRSEQHAKMSKFFKSAASALGGKSQGDQIAQVLNEKLSATPRLQRLGRTTLGPTFQIEEGQSSSAAGRIQGSGLPSGKKVNAGIARWAAQAEKISTFRDQRSIYKIYSKDAPPIAPMPVHEHRACLNKFKELNGKNGVSVWPQMLDGLSRRDRSHMTNTVIDQNPKAANEFYKIERSDARNDDVEIKARLTVNVKPEYAQALASAAAKLTGKNSDIISSKVAGPALIGTRTDAAIFYVGGDLAATEALAHKLQTMLPPDAFIDHAPMGMHSIAPGLYYAERTPTDKHTSHGMSRAAIIQSALDDPSKSSLQKKLSKAFEANGYNPENPAFRL